MNVLLSLSLIFLLSSCSSSKPKFYKEQVCSNQALKYLRNPRNKMKSISPQPALVQAMAKTTGNMQACYEDFKNRTGHEEFKTCLVVGVDDVGALDFYNFSSEEVRLDQKFLDCARSVTQSIPYQNYGSNYILIQSYKFYVGDF